LINKKKTNKIFMFIQSSLQRHNTPHPKDLRTWRNKMAKKFQTDGNLLHHDQQNPFRANTDPSISSGISTTPPNRTNTDSGNNPRESIDYIPPEISIDDQHDSDDVCYFFFMFFSNNFIGFN